MASIGIIANSASGKDIRRLVAHATVFNNNEKTNIIKRVVLSAQELGVDKVIIMPEFYQMGSVVKNRLELSKELKCEIEIADFELDHDLTDSVKAIKYMEDKGVGCVVTLGGDGTNRAVAKAVKNVPLITISTGTNNVYPDMIEGTVAGMAAAVVASKRFDIESLTTKDKRIEIYKDGDLVDIALVDAVVTLETFIGVKAVWNYENIKAVIVARSHPASIGFSSIVGMRQIINPDDDFGAYVELNEKGKSVISPVSVAALRKIVASDPVILKLGEEYEFKASFRGSIALDGEKEILFDEGDTFIFKITKNGPYRVDVVKTLETAQKAGFFVK
ncbi:MAG: ATP-NAD kinase [Clostridiales bacterium]|nr:ATP-NAD kinase [Clostridiales bacterium]